MCCRGVVCTAPEQAAVAEGESGAVPAGESIQAGLMNDR